MAARLSSKKVQIIVACLLAAVVVYNAVHFLGKKPGKHNFAYDESGLEDGTGLAMTPAWAAGDYEPAASWGTNPFTGKKVALHGLPAKAREAGSPPGLQSQ
jgi:hypothetical protein